MKKTLLLSLLALCSLCGAMAQTGNITVTGQVVNRRADAPKSVNLNLCDWFNATTRLNLPLDDDGHFRTQINFPVGHYFTMIYRDFIYAYAEPGDSLHVLIDDSRSEQDKQTVTFSGRNNGLSQLYEDYHQHLTPFIYAQKIPTKKSTLPLDYYLHLVYHTHQKMADSIQSYGRLHQLKDSDIRLLKNNAFFTLTDSYAESCGSNPQERLTFLSHPYFQLDNPDNLCNSLDYGVHLSYITYYFFRQDSILNKLQQSGNKLASAQRELELLLSRPKSLSRDVMLGMFFQKSKQVSLPDSSAFVLPAAWQLLKDQRVVQAKLDTTYIRFSTNTDSLQYYNKEKAIYQPLHTDDFFAHLRERHPGKILYVDIYTSWCGPCREDMKIAPDLHRHYQGKDVVFINLCLNSTLKSWQKMVDEGTVLGENYWFNDELTNRLIGLINLPGYPTYLLIDRKGHVVTRRAPRPSETETLVRLIDRTLEEK